MAKQVTDRRGAAQLIASSAEKNAELIASGFNDAYGSYLLPSDNAELPNVALMCKLVARRLIDTNKRLTDASAAHDKELSDDAAPRKARDDAAGDLTDLVADIHGVVERVYGPEVLVELGIAEKTPVDPKVVLETGKRLADCLADPKFVWPEPRRKGISVDSSVWLAELQVSISALDASLKAVSDEVREAQTTGNAKTKAMAENDDVFMRTATFLSAAFVLTNEDGLAARVRPSRRRPGTVEAVEEPVEEPVTPEK